MNLVFLAKTNQMTLKRNNMKESECCGASRWHTETDICSACKEHAEFIDLENE